MDIVTAGTYPVDGVVTVTMTGAESAWRLRTPTGERVYIEHDLVGTMVVVDLGGDRTKNGPPSWQT